MSLQLPSVISDLGLIFPALPCLSAGISWGQSRWAPLESSSLVPLQFWTLSFLGLSRCWYSPVVCQAQAWAIHRAQSCLESPHTDFCACSFSCALTNPLSHRACSGLSTKIAFALSSISFTYLLASLLFYLRTQLISSLCLSVSVAGLICAMSLWELSDQHPCAFPAVAPFGMQETP